MPVKTNKNGDCTVSDAIKQVRSRDEFDCYVCSAYIYDDNYCIVCSGILLAEINTITGNTRYKASLEDLKKDSTAYRWLKRIIKYI